MKADFLTSSEVRSKRKAHYWKNLSKERDKAKKRARKYRENLTQRNKLNKLRNKFSRTTKGKFGYAKIKARLKGIHFNISFSNYEKLINMGCHYCKKDLKTEVGVSLDRIDNNKGYIKSNVLPCCGNHNKLRGNYLTVKEAEVAIGAVLSLKNEGKIVINGWKITVKEI